MGFFILFIYENQSKKRLVLRTKPLFDWVEIYIWSLRHFFYCVFFVKLNL